MSALLELIKEAPPEDLESAAKLLKPYLVIKQEQPATDHLLGTKEFKKKLEQRFGIRKRLDWIRNDMFVQCPELKQFAYSRNAGSGHYCKIDEKALDWIADHKHDIDWKG